MRRTLFFIVAIFCSATSYASIPRVSVLDGASISRASMLDAAPAIADTLSETRIRVSDVLAPFERPVPSPLNRALHQAYAASSTTNASGLGRFLSVDPARRSVSYERPQTWNRYSYVLDSPLNLVDPDGRATRLIRDENGFRFAKDDNDDGIPDDLQGNEPNTPGHGIFGSSSVVNVQKFDRVMTATLGLINHVGIALLSWSMPGAGPSAKAESKAGIAITAKGLAIVEKHLARFGGDAANAAMLTRLRTALDTGRRVTSADANFYLHELAEATMMRGGMSYETAHAAASASMACRTTLYTTQKSLMRTPASSTMHGVHFGAFHETSQTARRRLSANLAR